jgi:hypothetical protein
MIYMENVVVNLQLHIVWKKCFELFFELGVLVSYAYACAMTLKNLNRWGQCGKP